MQCGCAIRNTSLGAPQACADADAAVLAEDMQPIASVELDVEAPAVESSNVGGSAAMASDILSQGGDNEESAGILAVDVLNDEPVSMRTRRRVLVRPDGLPDPRGPKFDDADDTFARCPPGNATSTSSGRDASTSAGATADLNTFKAELIIDERYSVRKKQVSGRCFVDLFLYNLHSQHWR